MTLGKRPNAQYCTFARRLAEQTRANAFQYPGHNGTTSVISHRALGGPCMIVVGRMTAGPAQKWCQKWTTPLVVRTSLCTVRRICISRYQTQCAQVGCSVRGRRRAWTSMHARSELCGTAARRDDGWRRAFILARARRARRRTHPPTRRALLRACARCLAPERQRAFIRLYIYKVAV